jgi:biopolymer transport protein ExbB/TolQ
MMPIELAGILTELRGFYVGLEGVVHPTLAAAVGTFVALLSAAALERWWVYRREGRFDEDLWESVRRLAADRRANEALNLCREHDGLFPHLYRAGLEAAGSARQNAADSMGAQKEEAELRFRQRLWVFSTTAVLAPLLGLVAAGTYYWKSAALAVSGPPPGPAVAAAVAGFALAIPAAALHLYFTQRAKAAAGRLSACALKLLVALYEKEPVPAPRPAVRFVEAGIPEIPVVTAPSAVPPAPAPAPVSAPVPPPAPAQSPAPAVEPVPVVKPAAWPPTGAAPTAPSRLPRPLAGVGAGPARDTPESVWDNLSHRL